VIKKNKILITVFLLAANIIVVTGITVQASSLASLQRSIDIKTVKMLDNINQSKAKEINMAFEMPATEIVPQIQERITEIEEQKAVKAQETAKYNQELLASVIFCEAGNQSYEGQVAVGAVVMNRINSDKFPDTMEEVIYQSGQFVPAMTGWLDKVRASSSYTESAMKAAKDAIMGVNPIGNCLFFDQGGYGYQIGAHFFH